MALEKHVYKKLCVSGVCYYIEIKNSSLIPLFIYNVHLFNNYNCRFSHTQVKIQCFKTHFSTGNDPGGQARSRL